jgi:hypothetical protein
MHYLDFDFSDEDSGRGSCLAPTVHTQMTEGLMPEAVLQAFRPAAVTRACCTW